MEGSSLEEVSSGQPGSSSRPSKVEGSGEGSTRLPKPSTRQPKVEGSSMEEESTPPPSMEPTTEEAEKKVRQGVWGDTTTTVLPEAYELLEEDIDRCGMPVFRICAFHMSAKIASKKPALMREAMGIMLADCFRNQVDYITAMLTWRAIGPAALSRDPLAFVTRVSRRWSGTISRPIRGAEWRSLLLSLG